MLPLCEQITALSTSTMKFLTKSNIFSEDNDDNFGFDLHNLITSVCRRRRSIIKMDYNNKSEVHCEDSSCSKRFKRKKYMIEHYKREHLNEISKICENCSRGFVHRSSYYRHKRFKRKKTVITNNELLFFSRITSCVCFNLVIAKRK